MQLLLQDALREKGFSVRPVKRGEFEVSQSTGFVSQNFKVTVESTDRDPI